MAANIRIGGVDCTGVIAPGADFSLTQGERGAATLVVDQTEFLPARFADVRFYATDGATPVWGGLVLTRRVVGVRPGAKDPQVTCQCVDYGWYGDYCYQTKTYADPVALEDVVADLVTDQLSLHGITYTPTTMGVTLDPFTWEDKQGTAALRELMDKAAAVGVPLVFTFSPTKVLTLFTPGSLSAPFAITDADPHCLDFEWADPDRAPATRVVLKCGPAGSWSATQAWTATGSATSWQTDLPSAGVIPGYVTVDGIFCTVGDGAMYTWDSATHTLSVGTAATPGAGIVISLTYLAQGPFTVISDSGATPPLTQIATAPDALTWADGQARADGLLARLHQPTIREGTVTTDEEGLCPGQGLSVDLACRAAEDAIFTVTSVHGVLQTSKDLLFTASVSEATVYQGSSLDLLRSAIGGGSASGSGVVSVGGGGGSGGVSVVSHLHAHLGGDPYQTDRTAVWKAILHRVPFLCPLSGTYTVRSSVQTDDAGTSIQMRLYDLTAAAAVAGSTTTVSTSTSGETTSALVALIAGHEYEAQEIGSNASAGIGVGYCTVQL